MAVLIHCVKADFRYSDFGNLLSFHSILIKFASKCTVCQDFASRKYSLPLFFPLMGMCHNIVNYRQQSFVSSPDTAVAYFRYLCLYN